MKQFLLAVCAAAGAWLFLGVTTALAADDHASPPHPSDRAADHQGHESAPGKEAVHSIGEPNRGQAVAAAARSDQDSAKPAGVPVKPASPEAHRQPAHEPSHTDDGGCDDCDRPNQPASQPKPPTKTGVQYAPQKAGAGDSEESPGPGSSDTQPRDTAPAQHGGGPDSSSKEIAGAESASKDGEDEESSSPRTKGNAAPSHSAVAQHGGSPDSSSRKSAADEGASAGSDEEESESSGPETGSAAPSPNAPAQQGDGPDSSTAKCDKSENANPPTQGFTSGVPALQIPSKAKRGSITFAAANADETSSGVVVDVGASTAGGASAAGAASSTTSAASAASAAPSQEEAGVARPVFRPSLPAEPDQKITDTKSTGANHRDASRPANRGNRWLAELLLLFVSAFTVVLTVLSAMGSRSWSWFPGIRPRKRTGG